VLLPGLLLGLLYPLNSWDYPTYVLLYGAALVWQSRQVGRTWREIAIEGVSVVGASYAWYLPFHLTFYSLVGGADPLVDIPLISTLSQFFGLAPARTEFHGLFIMFGLFMVPIVIALWRVLRTRNEQILYAATMLVAVVGAFTGFTTLAAIPWLALVFYIVSTRDDLAAPVAMWLAIATIAALLCLAVDVVYIRDVFSSRMNTVFKFYYQVWVLWSIAAVIAGWYVWHTGTRLLRGVLAVLVVPLLAAALVYPAATIGKQLFNARELNLAGRTPRDNADGGPASITWLRENAPQGSVIIEAIGGQYDIEGRGFGGVSASTGLPAVMGWPGHEDQWRGGHTEARQQIGEREQDVRTIYSSGDEARVRELIAKYKIRYIYVGPTERFVYGEEGLGLFDVIGTVAFQEGEVTIYDVK
jgi:YYY domain-containing protein